MSTLKPSVSELVRVEDRLSFLYVEYCVLNRDGGSVLAVRDTGTVALPTATVGTLWLGPSVTVTHHAMLLLFERGTVVIWTGEDGLAHYGAGRPLNGKTHLLSAQAAIHSSQHKRMSCARRMYAMRFGEKAPSSADTLNKLRAHEGNRVKSVYAKYAKEYGVPWNGRVFTPGKLSKSDPINQALTVAHHCLYAVISGVVHGIGAHPGISVVHNGTPSSFVYDIADLYKTELCVPAAFKVVASHPNETEFAASRLVRTEMRSNMVAERVVPQAVKDIYQLLLRADVDASYETIDHLWSQHGDVQGGINHGE